MTESDIQSFYIYSSRHNGKIFTISAPVPNLISIEKKNDSTNKVEQKLEIPKSIYDRMLSIFDLTDQLSYILAHGQLEYRTHQAVIYGASEEMERDAASCVVIEDFIIDQNHYARLSFEVYNPDNYKRSVRLFPHENIQSERRRAGLGEEDCYFLPERLHLSAHL